MGGFNSQSKPDGGNADGNIELGGGASSSAGNTAPPPSSSDGVLGGLSSGGLKLTAPVGPGAANKPRRRVAG